MKLCHSLKATSIRFDDPNLVGTVGLVPVMELARRAGLASLAEEWLRVPTDKGAHPGVKVSSVVAGMVAGADSIDDMGILRHGGMGRLFQGVCAPSTVGSFLRAFTFGHVRQLDAVASRLLRNLVDLAPGVVPESPWVFLDVDDTVIPVYSPAKQGARVGYTHVLGLDAVLVTLSGPGTAPVIVAQRLRHGAANSQRGAKRLLQDAFATTKRILTPGTRVLLRADSGFTGGGVVHTALSHGVDVSVTLRLTGPVWTAISTIGPDDWTPITDTHPFTDPGTGELITHVEVAETTYTMFSTKGTTTLPVTGRLIVRRFPDTRHGPDAFFPAWRYHAFFTTVPPDTMDLVTADQTHRRHAIIEQVHADLKHSALAHLPSHKFAANSAWLVLAVITYNLTRATATLAGLANATSTTIRTTLITIPARLATSGHHLTLHLPRAWPWHTHWNQLYTTLAPPG